MVKLDVNVKPDLSKALRHQNLTCPRIKDKAHNYNKLSVVDFNTDDMSRFGVGILLYFQFLKRMTYILLLLTFLSLPCLIINIMASSRVYSYGADSRFTFAQFSYAGWGYNYNSTNVLIPGFGDYITDSSIDRNALGVSYSAIDVFYSIVFLICVYYLAKNQTEESIRVDKENMTESDYTAKVDLIEPEYADRNEYKQFFENCVGPVHDVAIAYNDGEVVLKYKERGLLRSKLAAANFRKDEDEARSILIDIDRIDERIENLKKDLQLEPVQVFVTFEYLHDLENLLKYYPHSWYQRCCGDPKWKFRGESYFRIERAPEPTNILYHNLAYTAASQRNRRFISFFLTLSALLISFGICWAAKNATRSLPTAAACPTTTILIQSTYNSTDLLGCFCKQNAAKVFSDAEIQNHCLNWYKEYTLAESLTIGSGFVIVVVNSILIFVSEKLVLWEKRSSLTNQEAAIMSKVFIGMFVNTALISLIVNADFSRYAFGFLGGTYTDFTPEWYTSVGQTLMITMILNTVNPQLLNVLIIPFKYISQWYYSDKCSSQKELNDLYSGEVFSLANRYSALMNTIFVTFFYCGGMPILIPLAALSFAITHWCDRMSLFHACSIPPNYDDKLASRVIATLPTAIVLHSATSMWFYTTPVISEGYRISSSAGGISTDDFINFLAGNSEFQADVAKRVLNWNGFLCFLLFIGVAGYYVFYFIYNIIDELECCRSSKVVPLELIEQAVTYTAAIKKHKLTSYRLSDQPFYKDAFLRTDSLKQLKSIPSLTEPPKKNKDGDKSIAVSGVVDASGKPQLVKVVSACSSADLERSEADHSEMDAAEVADQASSSIPVAVYASSADELVGDQTQKLPEPVADVPAMYIDLSAIYDGMVSIENFNEEKLGQLIRQHNLLIDYPDQSITIQCDNCYNTFRVMDNGYPEDQICPNCAINFMA